MAATHLDSGEILSQATEHQAKHQERASQPVEYDRC